MAHALDHRQIKERKESAPAQTVTALDTGGIIGSSGPMRELMEMVSYVAPTEATVLISGESGTGKELIAAALHRNSARRNGPFIKVNCAALVENLLESELFGHEKGAFTGADRRRDGKFSQANDGTIFLDEISETSPGMQAKLLRVLQEHEVQRVGGPDTIAVDVRVLAASNRNLEEEVARGAFREDLYYRLNVVALHVPPLKDRKEDIPALAEYFVEKFAKKNNRQVAGITPRCMALLTSYPWPGNVRELENAIERGIILMRSDYLDEESLPIAVRRFAANNETPLSVAPPNSLEEAEQIVIKNILAETGGNKSEASRRLNITRKTLLSKMHKYGLT
jgi:two-component system response regulator HydG